jgi:hypothetical protein
VFAIALNFGFTGIVSVRTIIATVFSLAHDALAFGVGALGLNLPVHLFTILSVAKLD